jgi:hypothetical protein
MLSLTSLTACTGSRPIKEIEYIRPTIPELPPKPDYYPVRFKKVGNDYCFEDAEDAKNLLKNKILQDDRERSLEQIVEGLR